MLRGLGTAVSLPLLDVMESPAAASESVSKKTTRLAYLYIPNGVANGAWLPEEAGADGQLQKLNPWMKSLQPFASELTLFKNIWTPEGNGHSAGTATWLTGGGFNQENINLALPWSFCLCAQIWRLNAIRFIERLHPRIGDVILDKQCTCFIKKTIDYAIIIRFGVPN